MRSRSSASERSGRLPHDPANRHPMQPDAVVPEAGGGLCHRFDLSNPRARPSLSRRFWGFRQFARGSLMPQVERTRNGVRWFCRLEMCRPFRASNALSRRFAPAREVHPGPVSTRRIWVLLTFGACNAAGPARLAPARGHERSRTRRSGSGRHSRRSARGRTW